MKTLEKVLKKKIEPIVEEAMQKFLGVTINEMTGEITDRLDAPLWTFKIDTSIKFKIAKKLFKKDFITRLLKTHYGNVTDVAKILGLNRRSIHRQIKDLGVDIDACRKNLMSSNYFRKEVVDKMLRDTLDHYKSVIQPSALGKMYEGVGELSSDIVKELPTNEMTMKEAEHEFERRYLQVALEENNGNMTHTAKKIGLRYETLLRKLKDLGMK